MASKPRAAFVDLEAATAPAVVEVLLMAMAVLVEVARKVVALQRCPPLPKSLATARVFIL